MTTKYDPALCERLISEASEDDARMTEAPWYGRSRFISRVPDNTGMGATLHTNHIGNVAEPDDASGIARTRNNLRALADQLAAARAEVERLRPVVEAACEWCDADAPRDQSVQRALFTAIDAYRAARVRDGE